MEELSRFIPQLLDQIGSPEDLREQTALGAWSRIVGPSVRQHCFPSRLFNGRLVVLVSDRVWKTQMSRMSGEILPRLNQQLGPGSVTFIEYRLDPGRFTEAAQKEPRPASRQVALRVRRQLRDAADQINDPELRDLYLRAATSYLGRQGRR